MNSQSAGPTGGPQRPTAHVETREDETQTEDDNGSIRPVELSVDATFGILKNQRRRRVLRYLDEHEGTARLGELAEHIAALENDKSVAALSASERKRVYVGLYQCHLPKMDDLDAVAFDKNRGIVEPAANLARLKPYLDRESTTPTRPWYQYYATIGGVGLLAVAATHLGAALPTTGLFLAVLLAFLACVTAHTYTEVRLPESDDALLAAFRGRLPLAGDVVGRRTDQATTPSDSGASETVETEHETDHDSNPGAGGQATTGNSDRTAAPAPPEPNVDIPGEGTLPDVKAAVRSADTLYEVQQALDLEREEVLDLLRELELLELVHGRVATKRQRDELKERLN